MPKAPYITRVTAAALVLCATAPSMAQDQYKPMAPAIKKLMDTSVYPELDVAPGGRYANLVALRQDTPISDLAGPMLRLAGHRINPSTHGHFNPPVMTSLQIIDLPTGRTRPVQLPNNVRLSPPQWSPDGRKFVMLGTGDKDTGLWIGDAASGFLRRAPGLKLNAVLENPFCFLPGSRLVVKCVPESFQTPGQLKIPRGPKIQEHNPEKSRGEAIGSFQDLLQNSQDEALFQYYATSQLFVLDLVALSSRAFGGPAMFAHLESSPDAKHVLTSIIERPFSYQAPSSRFPHAWEVWSLDGGRKRIALTPLIEGIPVGGVRKGPRDFGWVPTEKATLKWIEALDEGNPRLRAAHRDSVMTSQAPFDKGPLERLRTEHRIESLLWMQGGGLLLREIDPLRNFSRLSLGADGKGAGMKVIREYRATDRFNHLENPITQPTPSGQMVIREEEGKIWMNGISTTIDGDRPFLDKLELTTGKTERLFQGNLQDFEECTHLLDQGQYITRREGPMEPPNYILNTPSNPAKFLTFHSDQNPERRKIRAQQVKFKRGDNVELSFTLYLPPDYQAGERRPALLWTQPATEGAELNEDSSQRFSRFQGASPLFMLMKGYAVLMNTTIPITGDPATISGNFLEQIIDSAQSAIKKAGELGFIDPSRVAVGGHGMGAFMAANLAAHTQFFRCAIARSGLYNRTLAPYGFQSEKRTLWESTETFLRTSPFMRASQFKAPILLIHSEADSNPITQPLQAEQLFQALKSNNHAVRYVSLPLEAHEYLAKESRAHIIWEMGEWLDRHMK